MCRTTTVPVASQEMKVKSETSAVSKRDVWGHGFEFVLACIGFAVGLGNIWRFPYLCYKNGGGAFLIPYFIYVVCGGVPLMFLEVGLGQFMSQGNISVWNICPLFKGIGIGTTIMTFWSNVYYIILMAWSLHFMLSSMTTNLPWSTCGNEWNTPNCISDSANDVNKTVVSNDTVDSVVEYWERRVLMMSEGLSDIGGIQWELAGTLLLAWILVYVCIFKGIKSSGKAVYFTALFPYVMLTVLLIRGLTLPGALKGLQFYIEPDFSKLFTSQIWIDAGTQVFYSYACTFGGMVSLGSFNRYHRNFIRDCTGVAVVNVFSSLYGGCVIFSVLGYMSHISGLPISDVAESGPGLVFIVYPKAISLMPGAPIWAFLFFFMISLIAIDSQFVCCEAVVTAIVDVSQMHLKFKREILTAVFCWLNFFLGLPMVTYGGMYVFQLFDYYAASGMVLLTFCFVESIAVSWVYGIDKWYGNIEDMVGRRMSPWLKICWCFLTPMLTFGLLTFAIFNYSPLVYNKTYVYPISGQLIGLGLGMSSVIFVPLCFFYELVKAPGVKLREKWRHATTSQMEKTLKLREMQSLDE